MAQPGGVSGIGAQNNGSALPPNNFALYSHLFGPAAPHFSQREVEWCPVDTDAWEKLTAFSHRQFDGSVRQLVANADRFVSEQLKSLQTYKEEIKRQAGDMSPDAVVVMVGGALSECRSMRGRLVENEAQLQSSLDEPLAKLFASLVCACREHSEQSAQCCPGTNINLELMKFTSSVHATLRKRKAWVDDLCAQRQLQVAQLCERLEGDLEDALSAAIDNEDDASMLDGSITDLLSTFDDLATMTTISSAASAATAASRTSVVGGGRGTGGSPRASMHGGGGSMHGGGGSIHGSHHGSAQGGSGHGSTHGGRAPA